MRCTKSKIEIIRHSKASTLAVIVGLLFVCSCAVTPIKPPSDPDLASSARSPQNLLPAFEHLLCNTPNYDTLDAIVRVANFETGGGDGSGIVIAPNVVLTAAHVVDMIERPESGLVYIGHQYKKASVLGFDEHSDLALLQVGTDNLTPIKLSKSGLRSNESVWAVGYPLALDQTTTKGEFFRYRNGGLLTSASIDAGSSGGGLLHCEDGVFKLAGMIRSYMAYYRQGVPVRLPKRSISVPVATIEAFVNLHGIEL